MNLLDPDELRRLLPAETHACASPILTQSVSSDEFVPRPQTAAQRRVEARIKEMGRRPRGVGHGRHLDRLAPVADRGAAAEAMLKQHGFAPLGPADGRVKRAILGETNARLYRYDQRAALATDRLAVARASYEASGTTRSNLRYGYVVKAGM